MKEIYLKVAQALIRTYGKKDGTDTFEEFINEVLTDQEKHKTKEKRA